MGEQVGKGSQTWNLMSREFSKHMILFMSWALPLKGKEPLASYEKSSLLSEPRIFNCYVQEDCGNISIYSMSH